MTVSGVTVARGTTDPARTVDANDPKTQIALVLILPGGIDISDLPTSVNGDSPQFGMTTDAASNIPAIDGKVHMSYANFDGSRDMYQLDGSVASMNFGRNILQFEGAATLASTTDLGKMLGGGVDASLNGWFNLSKGFQMNVFAECHATKQDSDKLLVGAGTSGVTFSLETLQIQFAYNGLFKNLSASINTTFSFDIPKFPKFKKTTVVATGHG